MPGSAQADRHCQHGVLPVRGMAVKQATLFAAMGAGHTMGNAAVPITLVRPAGSPDPHAAGARRTSRG